MKCEMNQYNFLLQMLKENDYLQDDYPLYAFIKTDNATASCLWENLLLIGEILKEDSDSSAYIAAIKTGILNLASCIIAAMVCEKTIYVVCTAHEGLLKQNLSAKAIRRLANSFKDAEVHYETKT